jgi:hypothetical protein
MSRNERLLKDAKRLSLTAGDAGLRDATNDLEASVTPIRAVPPRPPRARVNVPKNPPVETDMERFVRMDKERLVDIHKQELGALNGDLHGMREKIAVLETDLRRRKSTTDRLWLMVFGMALLIAYLILRDVGCK